MNTFEKILFLLNGKKAVIGSAINAIDIYLLAVDKISTPAGVLISTLVLIFTGVAVSATTSAIINNTNLGLAIKNKMLK